MEGEGTVGPRNICDLKNQYNYEDPSPSKNLESLGKMEFFLEDDVANYFFREKGRIFCKFTFQRIRIQETFFKPLSGRAKMIVFFHEFSVWQCMQ